jgi:hypothetical protein
MTDLVPAARDLIDFALDRYLMDLERRPSDSETYKRRQKEIEEMIGALRAELQLVEDIIILAGARGISADDELIDRAIPLLGRERAEGLRGLGEKIG